MGSTIDKFDASINYFIMQLHIRQMKALQWNLDITSLCITKSSIYSERFSSP